MNYGLYWRMPAPGPVVAYYEMPFRITDEMVERATLVLAEIAAGAILGTVNEETHSRILHSYRDEARRILAAALDTKQGDLMPTITSQEADVRDIVREHDDGQGVTTQRVINVAWRNGRGLTYDQTTRALRRLVDLGLLVKPKRGVYTLPPRGDDS